MLSLKYENGTWESVQICKIFNRRFVLIPKQLINLFVNLKKSIKYPTLICLHQSELPTAEPSMPSSEAALSIFLLYFE